MQTRSGGKEGLIFVRLFIFLNIVNVLVFADTKPTGIDMPAIVIDRAVTCINRAAVTCIDTDMRSVEVDIIVQALTRGVGGCGDVDGWGAPVCP